MNDPRRDALVILLEAHPVGDDAEVRAVAHLRRLLRGAADPFARTTLPAHVTASAVVLDPDGRVLLHRHRRLDRWLQPGGHVEDGEGPEAAAVRETVEETGLTVDHPGHGPVLVHVDEHPGPDRHVHLDLRYLLHADPTLRAGDGEDVGGGGAELRWTPMARTEDFDGSLRRAVAAVRARLA